MSGDWRICIKMLAHDQTDQVYIGFAGGWWDHIFIICDPADHAKLGAYHNTVVFQYYGVLDFSDHSFG